MTAGEHGRQGDSLYRYPIQVALGGFAVVAGVAGSPDLTGAHRSPRPFVE